MARLFSFKAHPASVVFVLTSLVFFLIIAGHAAIAGREALPYHVALLVAFVAGQGALGVFLFDVVRKMDQASSAFFTLFQGVPVGICSVLPDGTISRCNPGMASFLGKDQADRAVGADAAALFSRREPALGPFLEGVLRGHAFDKEVRIALGNESAWYRVFGVPVFDADGTVQQAVLMADDITPQRRLAASVGEQAARLEEQVAERTAALTSLRELYRTVLEVNLVGIYVLRDGVLRYVNPALRRMFGYDAPDEMIGMHWEALCTEKGKAQVKASGIAERLRGAGGQATYVFEGRRKNGSTVLVEVYSNPSFYEGTPAVIGSMRDVTDDVRNKENLAELQELQRRFIQIVAHQLRTPLNAMRWNMESLIAGEFGALKERQKDFLRATLDADVEVITRIRGLLATLDIQEGAALFHPGVVSLEDAWNGVWQEKAERCAARGVRCVYEAKKTRLPAISGDQQKIREAIEAVLDNAVVYTRAGGRVTARWEVDASRARLVVDDTGIGIPAADHPRIFTRFFRSTNAVLLRPDASGLGLANAKFYVEQHGGSIGFTSKENAGSSFWVDLPLHHE